MLRYRFRQDGTLVDTVSSENSTSQKQLTSFFKWAANSYAFKKSAVFFLDHGGGLNEIGQDLYPDSTFLTTNSIRKSLAKLNKWSETKIDLLYIQVCAKASIEPLYELHPFAKYTLACQKILGAPNYYYDEMIRQLSASPDMNGRQLAEIIATSDRSDMYKTLTGIDNSQFDKVRGDFRKLVVELKKQSQINFVKSPIHFDYANDRYWDLLDFLYCLDIQNPEAISARSTLISSIQNELIFQVWNTSKAINNFSGISIASLSKERIRVYWSMRFYKDFLLHQLRIN